MRFVILKKTSMIAAFLMLGVCAILAMSFGGNSAAAVFFGDNLRKVPIYSVDTTEKVVAISFDAAWGADKTQGIVDILKEYNATATFFLVGFWIDKFPDMVKYIQDAGLEIGTHTNTHPDMVKLTAEEMKLELTTCMEKLQAITDTPVKLFRAPFGSYNNTLLDVADGLGLKTIQWDVDSLDWKGLSASEMTQRVMSRVKNGSIILCHNNSDHILDALPLILERLKLQGYKVVSVGELIYQDQYIIDRAGIQKKN